MFDYLSKSSRAENKRWCLKCLLALYLWLVHAPLAWRNRWSNFNTIITCSVKGSKNNRANYSKHYLVTDVCTIFCTQDHLHIFMLQYFADPKFNAIIVANLVGQSSCWGSWLLPYLYHRHHRLKCSMIICTPSYPGIWFNPSVLLFQYPMIICCVL